MPGTIQTRKKKVRLLCVTYILILQMLRNVFNFTTVSINGAAQRTKGKEMRPMRTRDFKTEVSRCLTSTGLKMLAWIWPYITY